MSHGKLDIVAEGQTVAQAAASPQPQASFKTGEAAKEVQLLSYSWNTLFPPASLFGL